MHSRRNLIFALLGAALIGAIAYGFRPQPRMVDAAHVATGPLQVTVQEEGKTRVIDRYVISSPVAGYVPRITQRVGDKVDPAMTLELLEPLPAPALDARSRASAAARVEAAKAALQVSEANARASQADAEQARSEVQRLEELGEARSVSENELDRARANADAKAALQRSAAFAVDVSRHELAAARTALKYAGGEQSAERIAITTPVNGRVLRLYQQSEGVVGAGQPLLEVGDPAQLEVVVEVLSADAVRIAPGMRVVIERWGGEPLEGKVRLVEPVGFTKISALGVEEQRVLVIVDFNSPPAQWQQLGDGYRVDARFILWEGDKVLQIPASALFRHDGGWAVFVIDNNEARLRQVVPGKRSGLAAQIHEGLQEGETVITHPDEKIADGLAVELR
ncbi:MAG TPA: HlyD family efflux transporter periplasmic adaptor subunit [Gammaproteobacteria bacterium]